jgi:endonuclease YncB( thermonuclease family)
MRWLWILLFLFACNSTDDTDQNGKVVGISDGDTFTMLTTSNQQVKVRLYGIDCPERGQDFSTAARQALSNLIFGHIVRIEKKDTDRYGRIIAIVYNNKGINVNEQLLRDGFAWHYKQYDQNPAWADMVYEAQRMKKGLWIQVNPTPPWLWRQEKRNVAR